MKVYLSHSAKALPYARRVADLLRGEGLEAWLAEEQVMPGDNYAQEIGKALESCDAMVVLLTPEHDDTQMPQRDMSFAMGSFNYRRRVFPLIVTNHECMAVTKSLVPWIFLNFTKTVRPTGLDAIIKQIARQLSGNPQMGRASAASAR